MANAKLPRFVAQKPNDRAADLKKDLVDALGNFETFQSIICNKQMNVYGASPVPLTPLTDSRRQATLFSPHSANDSSFTHKQVSESNDQVKTHSNRIKKRDVSCSETVKKGRHEDADPRQNSHQRNQSASSSTASLCPAANVSQTVSVHKPLKSTEGVKPKNFVEKRTESKVSSTIRHVEKPADNCCRAKALPKKRIESNEIKKLGLGLSSDEEDSDESDSSSDSSDAESPSLPPFTAAKKPPSKTSSPQQTLMINIDQAPIHTAPSRKPVTNQWKGILDDIFGSSDPPQPLDSDTTEDRSTELPSDGQQSDGQGSALKQKQTLAVASCSSKTHSPDSGYVDGGSVGEEVVAKQSIDNNSVAVNEHNVTTAETVTRDDAKSKRRKKEKRVETIMTTVGCVSPLLSPIADRSLLCKIPLASIDPSERHQLLMEQNNELDELPLTERLRRLTDNRQQQQQLKRKKKKRVEEQGVASATKSHSSPSKKYKASPSNKSNEPPSKKSKLEAVNNVACKSTEKVTEMKEGQQKGMNEEEEEMMLCAPCKPSKIDLNPNGSLMDADYYQNKKARPIKHTADIETCKLRRTLLYFDSVVYFLLSVRALCDMKNGDKNKTPQMMKDTADLLRQVTERLLRAREELGSRQKRFVNRLHGVSLRAQAVLSYGQYSSRAGLAMANYHSLAQYWHRQSPRNKSSPADSGYNTASSGGSSGGSGQTDSRTPSPSRNGAQQTVSIPLDIDSIQKQQLASLHKLMFAHQHWQEARVKAPSPLDKAFFAHLDRVCGGLRLESSLIELAVYFATATDWIRRQADPSSQ